MLPVAANPTPPESGIAGAKRSPSDGRERHGGQGEAEASRGKQDHGGDAQRTVVSDDGGGGSCTAEPCGAKRLKRKGGLDIDINKALPGADSLGSPPAGEKSSPRRRHSLQIKKRELELEERMLELKEWRLRWAEASRRMDWELEKMRLENGRMKLENERLRLQLKRREWELGVEAKD